MPVFPLDPYVSQTSAVHRADPRVKALVAMCCIVGISAMPVRAHPAWIAGVFGLLCAAAAAAHLSLPTLWRRSAVVLPFILAGLALLFTTPGRAVWHGPLGLAVTDEGLRRLLLLALRSWLAVQVAVILSATTRFPDLLRALRDLGVPDVLAAIVGFMYRYLFVLVDEVRRMTVARDSRSASPAGRGGGTLAWRAGVTGKMAGSLFLRSYERSERIYAAMLARGYDGEIRTGRSLRVQPADLLAGGVAVACLAAALAAGLLL